MRIYFADGIEGRKEETAIKRAIRLSKKEGKAIMVVSEKYDYVGNRYAEIYRLYFVNGEKV